MRRGIDVFVETIPDVLLDRLAKVVECQERAILFTVLEGEQLGEQLLVTADGEQVGSGRTGSMACATS